MSDQASTVRDPRVLALSFLIGASAFAVDGSIPAIPAVSSALNADINAAQMTVGLYLLGYGLGQIPMGFLADVFGRRPVILSGMTLFVLAGSLAAYSTSIELLLTSRFFQGFFGASGAVVSRAIARDITSGRETTRLFAILTGAIGTAMMIAPIVGGLAMYASGWRATFSASPILGAIGVALTYLYVPETINRGSGKSMKDTFLEGARAYFGNRQPLMGTGLVMAAFCGLITFVTTSSEFLIVHNGFSEPSYGFYFAILAGGYVLGGLISRKAALGVSLPRLIRTVGFAFLASVVLLSITNHVTESSPFWLLPCFCIVFGCIGSTLALGTAFALAPLQNTAGMGAAFVGTFQLLAGSCFSVMLTTLNVHTSLLIVAALVLVGCTVFLLTRMISTGSDP